MARIIKLTLEPVYGDQTFMVNADQIMWLTQDESGGPTHLKFRDDSTRTVKESPNHIMAMANSNNH